MVVNNLFPTPVASFELGRDLSEIERECLFNLETRQNVGNFTSVEANVLGHPNLHSLTKFLNNSLQEYFNTVYAPKHDANLCITQSWVNYTNPGQFHHKHNHSNSLISGVFYIQASKETDKLHFFNETYQQIKIVSKELNIYNSESWWLPAVTGEQVKGDDLRISLSFNTFPKGIVGDETFLNVLKLG